MVLQCFNIRPGMAWHGADTNDVSETLNTSQFCHSCEFNFGDGNMLSKSSRLLPPTFRANLFVFLVFIVSIYGNDSGINAIDTQFIRSVSVALFLMCHSFIANIMR